MSDALAAWRAIRASVDWDALVDPHFAPGTDGHMAACDAALERALVRARASSTLDWPTLASWQRELVDDVSFRTTDAFAKGGKERYAFAPEIVMAFDRALVDAQRGPILARAARLYLDVAFFHPFADGNARSARLALDWVLTRAGLVLRDVRPLVVDRWADDPRGPSDLVRLLRLLVGSADPVATRPAR